MRLPLSLRAMRTGKKGQSTAKKNSASELKHRLFSTRLSPQGSESSVTKYPQHGGDKKLLGYSVGQTPLLGADERGCLVKIRISWASVPC